jgi:DNA-directed RNA polymerase subunit RPC12/RpoP
MVVAKLKCQMCGTHFDAEILDKDDPDEKYRPGNPIRCPRCNSPEVELLCKLRQTRRVG